ncbi:hypothetical protein SDC9_81324 [bioreactor metagenome]|uniref:Uncharacterized protein n=1 Tax=bioreactor metagenome TaxID=1076179 RepID=A0A644Z2A4_9ZZZZ
MKNIVINDYRKAASYDGVLKFLLGIISPTMTFIYFGFTRDFFIYQNKIEIIWK